MAKTATKTDTVPGKAKPAGKKTLTTTGGLDDLSALVATTKELEDTERAKTGSTNSFITLVKPNGQVLDKNNPAYMKDVKPFDYVIASKKLKISDKKQCVDATILGMFKVYAEKAKKERENEMAKTVQFWAPDDAVQYELSEGSQFERQLPNGNVLIPVHWVFLYLHNHPNVEGALLPFQSKGNAIYRDLEKLVKAESSVCTQLRVSVSNQGIYNEKFKKTDYYPAFEIVGKNYEITDDGKVRKAKDSNLDAETLKEILVRSKELYESYAQHKMVAKHAALPAPEGRPALTAGKAAYGNGDDDESVSF